MKIFFSVGEPSGDLHGANLIRAMKERRDDLQFVGYGGPKMAEAGCELHADLTKLAIMWFLRAFLNLHRFIGLMLQANRYFRDSRPDAVVLIDYPGFNWWIAARAKSHGIPVFYYGTPQLWAWAGWRVKKMRRYVDHVLCKLPFEEAWYRERNCNATFVGHPFFDQLRSHRLHEDFIAEQREKPGQLIAILPGSRSQEVAANLPAFLETAKKIVEQVPDARFAVAAYNENQAAYAFERIIASGLDIEVQVDRTPELIHAAHCCLACSGSVSLELLYHEKPTVIHYKISPFGLWVQSFFRKVRYITLVNILSTDKPFYEAEYFTYDPDALSAEQVLFPEYLTCEDRTGDMATRIVNWLHDDDAYARRVRELHTLRERVGGGGASMRGAEYILNKLQSDTVAPQKCAA
ncbi:lipid-A-disaccharide synthase [Blastopirellula marina]|uniref:Lipid-A-disaccharide synthase n=1 Tax=Blastopirellula marina DSM 3645 TaxID=314230 RepID=A4A2A0_9BACT|nr:lipid-A-disaccharide synthase [Blastopirellula marina]EAQ77132.1 lipid-A-disaccharide synthetase [Blastopirellula marina DSM 3645]